MNNQPEQELARKLVQYLDHGVDNLAPAVRERLLVARKAALANCSEQPQEVRGLAWAGRAGQLTEHRFYGARHVAMVAALVLALVGVAWWQSNVPNEVADIDASLLTDELPVNAYLDKGFDSWLKRSSR